MHLKQQTHSIGNEMQLHNIDGVYYIGRHSCVEIVNDALNKPKKHGSGWARKSTVPAMSFEYTYAKANGYK